MADTYLDTFEARGDLYNEAALIARSARSVERQLMLDLLSIERHHTVVDAPAGGGYLADGVRERVDADNQVICVEPSPKFSTAIRASYVRHVSPLDALPIPDGFADRVGSLAGLHHLGDKSAFFGEAFRVLKTGGVFGVADVLDGTPAAFFLNGPVDRYTTTGHHGLFLQMGECETLLATAGFSDVWEAHRSFYWTFSSTEQLVKYCKSLFGLVKATEEQVAEAVASHFAVERTGDAVKLPWSLVYAAGCKRS